MTWAGPLTKPARGSALVDARLRRRDRKATEDKKMQQARRRDGNECRWPRCEFKGLGLPIDVCHSVHRGMGGNKAGDRTEPELLWTACRAHHGLYDTGEVEVVPRTAAQFDGPCDFLKRSESGGYLLYASESAIGISEERGV